MPLGMLITFSSSNISQPEEYYHEDYRFAACAGIRRFRG